MKRYKCTKCGYIIKGKIGKTYTCPKCNAKREEFILLNEAKPIPISKTNPSIQRIEDKCITCGKCREVCEQMVGIKYNNKKIKEPICINCGHCKLYCPTGAIVEKYAYEQVRDLIKDKNKIVIAITSPAVRVALGEVFDMPFGSFVEEKMVNALKKLGFDYVFDTTFGADLTIMEESTELLRRIKEKELKPMFSSCCPAWVKYMEMYCPKQLKHLSSTKTPIEMQSAILKKYFSKQKNIEEKNMVVVAITPCTAKKYEATIDKNLDYVITTSELGIFLKEKQVDFDKLQESKYDKLFGKGSGAGLIFGNSGGVTESILRNVYFILTGKDPKKQLLDFKEVRGMKNFKEATVRINDKTLNVASIIGLQEAKKIMKLLNKNKKIKYDFIEVMNCPGGCIGGGGQPLTAIQKLEEAREARMKSLYNNDDNSTIRTSYNNPDIINIYKEYLEYPESEKSMELLHTSYKDRSNLRKK